MLADRHHPADTPTDADPSTVADGPLERADDVAHALVRTLRTLRAVRHSIPRPHPAVDPLSYPVLVALTAGPLRVSDLAGALQEELSTVSRQASTLVQHGLVDKVPDPLDGRASLLSLTGQGRSLLARVRRQRALLFADLLHDWSDDEVAAFTHSLDRLTQAIVEVAPRPASEVSR